MKESSPTPLSPTAVTFVLPGDFRSGGVRVTVLMANLLLARGYRVRIACPKPSRSPLALLRQFYRTRIKARGKNSGWLGQFKGTLENYRNLDELTYKPGEIVIAVGTYMVADVRAMRKPVVKVRFNHGFPAKPDAAQEAAWHGRMPTITVSNTLVPRLQKQTGGSVWGVVPNGVEPTDYFIESDAAHDGLGVCYNPHPNKAPHDMLALLQQAHARWPQIPQYVFSTEECPPELAHTQFSRYPSVPDARKLYNRARVWLVTSYTEGLPGVVLEALACGCVVISTDNDGSLEVLRHEKNGLVVAKGDLPAFLAQIDRVFTDDSLRQRLAAGAAASAAEFTWERAADRMEAFLQVAPALAQSMQSPV